MRVAAGKPPSGVVTFLFTDIEGSTRRWESDAAAMRSALAAHDRVLGSTVEKHDGFLFKHTGDGVCAAFGSPSAAVNAAIAAQRELELPVRMGLATGEAELRDGDYFGTVLNRAARVMAAGHGGQILLADSTAVLLSGTDLHDLGPRRLRDVPTPVGVFQVRAPGLRTDFPTLRTVEPAPGNLRPPITNLIGRDSAVAELQANLQEHRFVTLTGPGGVGKTRLALAVATQLAGEFADGVWVFELAAVADPAAVPDAVAATLGIAQQPGKTVTESVADALDGRVRLLIFDNCEHVRDAAADVTEVVLARAPTVKILATSREGLGAADEQVWLVPSLDLSRGADSAAVELFVERARSVSTRFSLSASDTAAAVVEICRRVDGIPLAIELAASRMASMTATEVRDRLDQRFRLLVGSRRGLERHQTLRHAVQWSFELLTDTERTLLERCSVFAGGFDLDAACAVTHSGDEFATLDLLDSLVRKSLVVADRSSGHTRFSMLETIRQFAEEQLDARGEAAAARDAHARYFAGRVDAICALWDGPRQREAYDWFATELANLRTAFRWSADQRDLDTAAAIAMLAGLLGGLVEVLEPVNWAEELVEPARAVGHPRLQAVCSYASVCYLLGRVQDALAYSSLGFDAGRPAEGVLTQMGELWLGSVYSFIGEPERNIEVWRELLARGTDTHGIKRISVVVALANAGRFGDARSAAIGMMAAAEATRNPYVISYALLADGMAQRRDDPPGALDSLRRGTVIAQESGNVTNATYLMMVSAIMAAQLETEHADPLIALDNLGLAIRTYDDAGNTTQIRSALGILATLLDRHGHSEPAAVIAGFAAVAPTAAPTQPEFGIALDHLRQVLGDQTYASLIRTGETMTVSAVVAYSLEQIDRARTQLHP